MELVSTMEISGEEREIADAYARGKIDGVNSNLDGLGYGENAGGANIWDEVWEVYGNTIRSSYIGANASSKYYINNNYQSFKCFDESYNYLGETTYAKKGNGYVITTLANTRYIRFVMPSTYGTIYKNDIIVSVGENETSYKPYIPSVKMLADEVSAQNESLGALGKCKNLLNPTLQTTTFNGVTCTNNRDGTYTFNGTSTNATYFQLSSQTFDLSKMYKIVGCPKGGVGKYSIYDDKNMITGVADKGDGGKPYNPSVNPKLYISIEANVELNNLVFKPMLTENLNATYDDFVPYTGDGETLTADVASLKNDLSKQCKKDDITTNETLIGTFNGKNYYRKLFTGISGSGGSITVNVGEKIEIYNYYGRAYTYGQSGASDVKYPIPNKNYYIDSQNASETSFQLTIPTSSDTRKVDLVIEYTKVDE